MEFLMQNMGGLGIIARYSSRKASMEGRNSPSGNMTVNAITGNCWIMLAVNVCVMQQMVSHPRS
jgi:hypothetical protein